MVVGDPSKSHDVRSLFVTRSPGHRGYFLALPGDQSGHLTKTVVTGVTEHEGLTYYHHAHVYDGSYEDGTASCRARETCEPKIFWGLEKKLDGSTARVGWELWIVE